MDDTTVDYLNARALRLWEIAHMATSAVLELNVRGDPAPEVEELARVLYEEAISAQLIVALGVSVGQKKGVD